VVVRGTVQGVGFRAFARDVALALDLAGTVRNLPSGDAVEASVQGRPADVASFIHALRHGPPGALVHSVETSPQPVDPTLTMFRVLL
jgi:acylphosphatase